jgi:SAM-dependent methyltransferase
MGRSHYAAHSRLTISLVWVPFVAILHRVSSVRQAFDRHAPVYDKVFSASELRSEVWKIAARYFSPGMHVLDLGCGTGEDAIHLARCGLKVTAIDISSGMIAQLKMKAGEIVDCLATDMCTYAPAGIRFDGILSNFGALNYVSELNWLRRVPLNAGSHVVLTTVGRFYPFETAVFLLKRKPKLAFRRFGRSCNVVLEGIPIHVYYHNVRSIQNSLGPSFELKRVVGLRSLLPVPPYQHLERFRLVHLLKPLDRWVCSHRLTATCCDQFVSVWRYREM